MCVVCVVMTQLLYGKSPPPTVGVHVHACFSKLLLRACTVRLRRCTRTVYTLVIKEVVPLGTVVLELSLQQ